MCTVHLCKQMNEYSKPCIQYIYSKCTTRNFTANYPKFLTLHQNSVPQSLTLHHYYLLTLNFPSIFSSTP